MHITGIMHTFLELQHVYIYIYIETHTRTIIVKNVKHASDRNM